MKKAGIRGAARHLFLCVGPDCCKSREGEVTWQYVKKRLKECQLEIMRTKAACFRICTGGPWLVVYPDGVWYGRVTPARFERILQQHLLGDEPVREWVAAKNDFSCGDYRGTGAITNSGAKPRRAGSPPRDRATKCGPTTKGPPRPAGA
jgi:(2Fe-2S) ferredoxin